MSRSSSKERKGRKYASTKKWVEKQSSGFQSTYLRLPKGASLYQAKAGSALLDILPYEVKKGNEVAGGNPHAEKGLLYWERTFFVHRNVGPNQEAFVCLAKTLKKKCPICEERARIMKNDPDEDEEKMAKDLLPKERQVMNVIDLKNPEKGVQILEMSFFNFGERLQDELKNADEDDHWELFYTHDEGKTLKVGWGEDTMGTTKFIRADSIHFKDRKKEYDEDEILEKTFDLDDLLIIKSYDELNEIFLQAAETDKKKGKKAKDDDDDDSDSDEEDEDEEEDEDDEDEDEKPKKGAKSKSKKSEDSDDDEDEDDDSDEEDSDDDDDSDEEEEEEDEDEDEDDDEPKKKAKKKSSKDDDDDEEDEDEDDSDEDSDDDDDSEEDEDEEDDDDDEPKKKKGAAKKSSKSDDDDEDEEDDDSEEEDEDEEESDDDEDEEEEDDEDEKPSKKSKSKSKKSSKDDDEDEEEEDSDEEDEDSDDDDFGDFDEEDEDDDKPKKKKKK